MRLKKSNCIKDSKINAPDINPIKERETNEEQDGAQLPPPDKRHENIPKQQVIALEEDSAPVGFRPVIYGPKSVFKDGIIGNYEPKFEPKTGPGEMGKPVYISMSERTEADR